MNEPDGQHISGYDPAVAGQLVAEAADLMRAIGFTAAHVVLIGGLVPSLLVPVLDRASSRTSARPTWTCA